MLALSGREPSERGQGFLPRTQREGLQGGGCPGIRSWTSGVQAGRLPTCSKTENLMAYSGAILSTLIPLPRHIERTPPSWIMLRRPPSRFRRLFLDEYTWGSPEEHQLIFSPTPSPPSPTRPTSAQFPASFSLFYFPLLETEEETPKPLHTELDSQPFFKKFETLAY